MLYFGTDRIERKMEEEEEEEKGRKSVARFRRISEMALRKQISIDLSNPREYLEWFYVTTRYLLGFQAVLDGEI